MIRRRLAVALVAATSTTLALVSPVQAQEGATASDPSLSSLSSADGSGAGDTGDAGGAGSMELDEDAELAFEIVKAVMAVGLAVTQGAIMVLPFIPDGEAQLRNFLGQFGIRV